MYSAWATRLRRQASFRAGAAPARASCGPSRSPSSASLPIERRSTAPASRCPACAGASRCRRPRHVAQLAVGDHHALHHGRQADRADLADIVGPDAEQLVGSLTSLRRAEVRRVDHLHDLLDRRGRLHAFGALVVDTSWAERPEGQGRLVAHVELGLAGEREAAGVLVPDLDHAARRIAHREMRRALADLRWSRCRPPPSPRRPAGHVGPAAEGRHDADLEVAGSPLGSSRKPCASRSVRPMPSSSWLALSRLCSVYLRRARRREKTDAAAPAPAGGLRQARGRRHSLICSRSIACDIAMRKSLFAISSPISGSAL